METGLVQQYLERSLKAPGKTAILDGRLEIAYGDLSVLSNRLSRCLEALGVCRGDRVVLCLQRSSMCYPAILGILKADAAYVPLDPKAPPERWRKILEDCAPAAFLCDSSSAAKAMELFSAGNDPPVIFLDYRSGQSVPDCWLTQEDVESHEAAERTYGNGEDDIAYIMYTSGSTGQPKGVMISHRNISTYIDWAVKCFAIGENDRILSTAPFHFDMSTFDIFCPLRVGATLCVAPDNMMLFPEKLFRFIEEHEVTIWKGVSSLLMYMEKAGVVRSGRIPSMKRILFGGENLPAKYLIRWMESFPEKNFYNAYGPTETTGVSMYFHVKETPKTDDERIPIGIPRDNTPVWLLENHVPVRTGEVGELFIGGAGVGKGYLNDPEKTRKAFIPNPVTHLPGDTLYATGDLAIRRADGNYEFVGRKDHQVKIMGHRIELGDIENAILSHQGVKDCAVIQVSPGAGDFRELDDGRNSLDVMSFIQGKLPPYMVPKHLVEVKGVPRNDRGKIDRKAINEIYLRSK